MPNSSSVPDGTYAGPVTVSRTFVVGGVSATRMSDSACGSAVQVPSRHCTNRSCAASTRHSDIGPTDGGQHAQREVLQAGVVEGSGPAQCLLQPHLKHLPRLGSRVGGRLAAVDLAGVGVGELVLVGHLVRLVAGAVEVFQAALRLNLALVVDGAGPDVGELQSLD